MGLWMTLGIVNTSTIYAFNDSKRLPQNTQ
jgi:hypothetical protein